MAQRPILIVVHQEHSTPGRVGQMLRARGHRLDIRRPRFGDALPPSMEDHAGAIIFGGPMSANDQEDYLVEETRWLEVPLKEKAPLMGICLGAQMLARHLGARVYEHPDGHVEIGYYPIRPTQAGEELGPWPRRMYQWHREGFELPRDAELLATTDTYENQAFRYGPSAFGLQFHIELTLAMVHRWTTIGAERLKLRGARPRATHFYDRYIYDAENRAWLDNFLCTWLRSDRRNGPN